MRSKCDLVTETDCQAVGMWPHKPASEPVLATFERAFGAGKDRVSEAATFGRASSCRLAASLVEEDNFVAIKFNTMLAINWIRFRS
ncbi:unnamed protein product [Protopolystoma xenopodis]|uniref:Uncharacterized protein n=1 Tax=Protopolystoma xenopodis TaxID=117903 RepID=A0A3S4ZHV9_9PLAT|nr:unnamed protein product [Protopolystoma xenopodis]